MTGTNIGTGNYIPAQVLRDRGYTLVRLVSLPTVEDYAASLRGVGISILAIITGESRGYVMSNADVFQFDNERDMDQDPRVYRDNATFYQRTYPNLNWISCGMSSGDPNWWLAIKNNGGLPGFSGFAVHPYGKSPDSAKTLLQAYIKVTPNMDCWVTEWNRPAGEIPRMQKMLRELCVHDLWFCSDCGVTGFNEAPLILHAS